MDNGPKASFEARLKLFTLFTLIRKVTMLYPKNIKLKDFIHARISDATRYAADLALQIEAMRAITVTIANR